MSQWYGLGGSRVVGVKGWWESRSSRVQGVVGSRGSGVMGWWGSGGW